MSIEENQYLQNVIEKYVPEEYTPTIFNVIISFDMDGVVAEFMTNPEEYMLKLRELRQDVLNLPTQDNMSAQDYIETIKAWGNKLISEITAYENDVKLLAKEYNEKVGELLSNINRPAWMEPEYYRWLPAMANMVEAIKMLSKINQIKDENGVVYNVMLTFCSCAPNSQAELDKHIWLNVHDLDFSIKRIIVPYDERDSGINKAIGLGVPIYDPRVPPPTPKQIEYWKYTLCVHFDDNTKVLNDMSKYGILGVKCINGINDTHKSFVGPRVDIRNEPVVIVSDMLRTTVKEITNEMNRRYLSSEHQNNKYAELASNEPDIEPLPDVDKDARNNNNER